MHGYAWLVIQAGGLNELEWGDQSVIVSSPSDADCLDLKISYLFP